MPFYKRENEELHAAPNFVYGPGVSLTAETKDDYEYPVEGWYWFDNLDAAMAALINLPETSDISALAGLAVIDEFGLAGAYTAWATSPDRTFMERAFIDKATTWKRDNAALNTAATALGLTAVQMDAMFVRARELEATL